VPAVAMDLFAGELGGGLDKWRVGHGSSRVVRTMS
jgi:hypothetical protein